MATDGWDIFYRLTPFKGYQWEKQSKSFNFWWGRTWFTAVSTAAGEGSKIIGSASTQHGVGSESRTCSSHLNLKKKKLWEVVSIPANPILHRGLWAAVSSADNSQGWNFKGPMKGEMADARHLLLRPRISPWAMGDALIGEVQIVFICWFLDFQNCQNMFHFPVILRAIGNLRQRENYKSILKFKKK